MLNLHNLWCVTHPLSGYIKISFSIWVKTLKNLFIVNIVYEQLLTHCHLMMIRWFA